MRKLTHRVHGHRSPSAGRQPRRRPDSGSSGAAAGPRSLCRARTPLGTLTWRPGPAERVGARCVGLNCRRPRRSQCPGTGQTRFFRGRYVDGGDLDRLHGRRRRQTLVRPLRRQRRDLQVRRLRRLDRLRDAEREELQFGRSTSRTAASPRTGAACSAPGPAHARDRRHRGARPFARSRASGRAGSPVVALRSSASDNSGAAATLRADDLPERPHAARRSRCPRGPTAVYHRPLAPA